MEPCTPSNAGLAWSRSAALALVLAWLASCSSLPHWMPGSTRHAPARISAADYDRAMSEAREIELRPVDDRVGGLNLVLIGANDPEAMVNFQRSLWKIAK